MVLLEINGVSVLHDSHVDWKLLVVLDPLFICLLNPMVTYFRVTCFALPIVKLTYELKENVVSTFLTVVNLLEVGNRYFLAN